VFSVTLRPLYRREEEPMRIVHEAEWVSGPVWTFADISRTPGFDPRNFQPVTSHYTDCTLPAHFLEGIHQFNETDPNIFYPQEAVIFVYLKHMQYLRIS
jgi:hypothetical protein